MYNENLSKSCQFKSFYIYVKFPLFIENDCAKTRALIDTGASYSSINFNFKKNNIEENQFRIKLKQAVGNIINMKVRKFRLQVLIVNRTGSIDFLAIDDLNEQMILGIDFLQENKVLFDPFKGLIIPRDGILYIFTKKKI